MNSKRYWWHVENISTTQISQFPRNRILAKHKSTVYCNVMFSLIWIRLDQIHDKDKITQKCIQLLSIKHTHRPSVLETLKTWHHARCPASFHQCRKLLQICDTSDAPQRKVELYAYNQHGIILILVKNYTRCFYWSQPFRSSIEKSVLER